MILIRGYLLTKICSSEIAERVWMESTNSSTSIRLPSKDISWVDMEMRSVSWMKLTEPPDTHCLCISSVCQQMSWLLAHSELKQRTVYPSRRPFPSSNPGIQTGSLCIPCVTMQMRKYHRLNLFFQVF